MSHESGKFLTLCGSWKRRKRKRKKRKKEKERKEKIFPEFLLIDFVLSWVLFDGHLGLFSSQLKRISINYKPLQLETSITLYWMTHLTTIMLAILADILGCDITLSLYRINLTSNSPLDFQKLIHLGIKFVSEWGSLMSCLKCSGMLILNPHDLNKDVDGLAT